MKNKTNLIVGCGLSGIIMANRIANELGQSVVIIDSRDHIGGQCYDYYDADAGIMIHKYGAHIFRTNNKNFWDYLTRYTDWHPYSHTVRAMIDDHEVPVPFNLNSLHACFDSETADRMEQKLIARFGRDVKVQILKLRQESDADLSRLADFIYEKLFLNYTEKQWGLKPEQLNPDVTGSVPVYIGTDNRYFTELYQGIPLNGYTAMFEKMLDNPLITVRLNTPFDKSMINEFDRIFYSGSIDDFFDYELGKLPYRATIFDFKTINQSYFQRGAAINYPNDVDFTRIIEHKYLTGAKSDKTVISYEFSEEFEPGKNERFYPILNDDNLKMHSAYMDIAKQYKNLHFFGKLGAYKYYDMNRTIAGAFELFDKIKNQ